MAVGLETLFGKRVDFERLYERLRQVNPPGKVPSGELGLALVVEQLLERIESLEADVAAMTAPGGSGATGVAGVTGGAGGSNSAGGGVRATGTVISGDLHGGATGGAGGSNSSGGGK